MQVAERQIDCLACQYMKNNILSEDVVKWPKSLYNTTVLRHDLLCNTHRTFMQNHLKSTAITKDK